MKVSTEFSPNTRTLIIYQGYWKKVVFSSLSVFYGSKLNIFRQTQLEILIY